MRRLLPLLALLTTLGHVGDRALAGPPQGRAWIDVQVVRGNQPVVASLEVRRLGDLLELAYDRPGMESRDLDARRRWLEPQADGGPALVSKATSPEGQARFEGLAPGLYELLAREGQALEARSLVQLEVDGQHASQLLRLSTGRESLRGQLLQADGRAFVGRVIVDQPRAARVARPWLDGAWERNTDAEGRFELVGLEPGLVGITALVPGRLRVRLGEVRLPLEAPWVGTLPALAGGPTGTVVDGVTGEPIAGAEVFAADSAYPASGFTFLRVETAAHGNFELPALLHEPELLCVAAGYAAAWRQFPPLAGALAPLQLDAAARIEGLVLAPDGAPVPKVRVGVRPAYVDADPHVVWARTDAQGRYALDGLAPVETRIVVSDAGWRSPRAEQERHDEYAPCAERLEAGRTHGITHRVEPAGWVEGRVVDEEGKGIAGALVRCRLEEDVPDATTATDDSGSYRLRGLASGGLCALLVSAPGRRPGSLKAVPIGGRAPELTLQRLAMRWVRVHVIDDVEGAPIVGAGVVAESRLRGTGEGSVRLAPVWGATGTDGTVWVGPVARDGLYVYASDRGRVPTPSLEVATTAEGPITLVLGPRTHELRGRILPPNGGPLPARLALLRSQPGEAPIGALRDGGAVVPVGTDGRFFVEDLAYGRYVLRASGVAEGRIVEGQALAVPGHGEVTIPLRPTKRDAPAEWRFRVTTHDGRPVPHATLWVEEDARRDTRTFEPNAVVDQEWTYVASNERIGLLLRVLVGDARMLSGRALPYGWTLLENVEPSEEPITIELPAEDALEGQILDPAGRPLRGVRIQSEVLVDDSVAPPEGVDLDRSALSNEDGSFRLGGLRADLWRVRIRLGVPPDCAREPRLWAPHGLVPDLRVKLCHAVPGGLRVLDADGGPVPGCRLRIEPDETDFWTFEDNVHFEGFYSGPAWVVEKTGPDGRGGFTRLDPRRAYALFVEPPGTGPDLPVHLPAWRPQVEETLVLRAAPR